MNIISKLNLKNNPMKNMDWNYILKKLSNVIGSLFLFQSFDQCEVDAPII